MELRITTADGSTRDTAIKPADFVAFERKFDIEWATVETRPRMEHIYFLAFNSLRRTGNTSDDFDTWLDTVDDLDAVEEVPLVRPVAS